MKTILFGIILLIVSIPFIQHATQFAKSKGLWGAVETKEPAEFSFESWKTGKYQKNTEAYLNEAFGFRPDFVRLHNQIQFSLFSQPHANGVVIGKDWYLYESNYIKAYYGQDFIGDSLITERTRKLKFIQDTLQKQGREILVVLAPGKGTFFPEYFPDSLISTKSRTNYEAYLEQFNKQNIQYVDFQKWFLSMKNRSEYPLYPKCGIHWSKYGEMLVADSLIRKIESITERDLPDLVIEKFTIQDKNEEGDYDIAKGMNLILHMPTYPMAYPEFRVEGMEKNITRTLFVSDSYYWGMYHYNFSQVMFGYGEFWFYNTEIYRDKLTADGYVSDISIKDEVEKHQVIVLMSTDANLPQFCFGFIDQLYDQYTH
ncbi:MAG: hypothetical protein AB8B56_11970 [Crocinitomicaceae bacterium]